MELVTRVRDNDGFTLPELLVAVTIGFIVLAATLGLLESTLRLSGGVMAKTDAMQRGRLAMDKITQQMRSQVCPDLDKSAIIEGSDASKMLFYADFSEGDGSVPLQKRELVFPAASTGSITQRVITGTGPTGGPYSFTGTPQANMILENVSRQKKTDGTPIDFLRYYAYQPVGNPAVPKPTQQLSPPLDKGEAARVARIEVAFVSRPTRSTDDKQGVNLSDQVIVRHANPNLTIADPACV